MRSQFLGLEAINMPLLTELGKEDAIKHLKLFRSAYRGFPRAEISRGLMVSSVTGVGFRSVGDPSDVNNPCQNPQP